MPRLAPGTPRTPHHVARVAPTDSGVPNQARPREARVPARVAAREGLDARLAVAAAWGSLLVLFRRRFLPVLGVVEVVRRDHRSRTFALDQVPAVQGLEIVVVFAEASQI